MTRRLAVIPGGNSGPELEPLPGSPGWWYLPGGGPLWKTAKDDLLQVLAWSPKVTERLVVTGENGKPAGCWYVVRVGEDELTVSKADLASGEAWQQFADATGTGAKTVRDALLNVVEAEAAKLARTRVVDRCGWHELPGAGRVYVHADGRTYPAGAPIRLVGMHERLARAAALPSGPPDDVAIRAALAKVGKLGSPLLLSIGAAARSLGYSLRPALVSVVFEGEPASGKTATVDVGRSLSFSGPWPPVATSSFADTVTILERHVNREGDVLAFLDDLALAGDASEVEQRDANTKLERVLRAAGNGTSMRDRSSRDLTDRPGSYARGIVAVTAQHLPTTMQASLFRRIVVVPMRRGEVDTAWLRQHGTTLKAPLRAIGERIIARLHAAGADAGELLEELDRAAAHRLGVHLDQAMPSRSDLAHGVALLASHLVAGLLLVADVAGLDREELAGPAVERLGEALAEQVRRMGDRETASEDLGEAVGEIVRDALFGQRAHIRDQRGGIGPLTVPDREPQALGLSERQDGSWSVKGPALYWLPERGGIGVRSEDLYSLIRASRDPRVRGRSRASLPADLLKAGALVPSAQKGVAASHRVRIGPGEGSPLRLILLRAGLVFPPDDDDSSDPLPPGGGTGGTGGTGQVNDLPTEPPPRSPELADSALTSGVPPVPPVPPVPDRAPSATRSWRCTRCGHQTVAITNMTGFPHPTCGGRFGPDRPSEAPPAAPEPTSSEPGPAAGDDEDQDVTAVAPAPRVPGALDAAGLHLPDGRVVSVEDRSTGAAIAAAAAGAGVRDVWLHAEVTRALGLQPARLQEQAEASPFLVSAGEWTAGQDRLTSMVVYRRGAEHQVTRLHLVSDVPGSRLESLAGARDGAELLRFVLRFEALTGARWDGTASQTTAHLRRELARGNKGMSPGAYNPTAQLPAALARGVVRAPSWYRLLPAELAERYPHVVLVDQRANYLAVLGDQLAAKAPRHVGPTELAQLPRAGWARVRAGAWPDPESFDPLGTMRHAADETGSFWADLHSLRYAAGAGAAVEVLEAWIFDSSRRFLAPVKDRLRDALYALEETGGPEREALRPLVKAMYSEFVGWLAADAYHDAGDVLWRPDWHDAILAAAAVVTHRKALRAPGRVVAVRTDALGVLLERDDPEQAAALLRGQLGERLGDFKPEGSWPAALHVLGPDVGDPDQATVEIRRRVLDWRRSGGER